MAVASGTARLAGDGIRPHGLGCEGDAKADRDERDVPAVVEGHTGVVEARSRQPAAYACFADAPLGRNGARPGARDFGAVGREDRRSIGEALPTGGTVEGT